MKCGIYFCVFALNLYDGRLRLNNCKKKTKNTQKRHKLTLHNEQVTLGRIPTDILDVGS